MEECLARAGKCANSSIAAEESKLLREQLENERAAQAELRTEAGDLREKVAELERGLSAAKEAAARAEGQDAARREAVEAYMAKLDEERFERKKLQTQLRAASEEVEPLPLPAPPLSFPSPSN